MQIKEYEFGHLKCCLINLRDLEKNHPIFYPEMWLDDKDFNQFNSFKSEKRKLEFSAVRFLLCHLEIETNFYYEGHAPKLNNGSFISVSHAADYVVVGISSEYPIGVDIEKISDKASVVYQKFVNAREKLLFPQSDFKSTTLLWSLKETVYKIMGIEGLQFSEQIVVNLIGERSYKATVLTSRGIFEVPLDYQIFDDYVLTFNSGDVQRQK